MNKKITLLFLLVLSVFAAQAQEEVDLNISFSDPILLSGGTRTNYLKIGLTGFRADLTGERPAVNAAIVLDVSGSMQGQKIEQAVMAARTAIDMLRDGDIASIITYSDYAEVLMPAQPLSSRNRTRFHIILDGIYADGSTALFSGVSMGGSQLDLYLSDQMVNRVILLSDGLANVGPSTPGELGNLGEILRRRGISVSTIGLGAGYNDALMFELANRSDGNHAFVENPRDLVGIFEKEFETLMAVVAQDLKVRIRCGDGVRPVRLINRIGEIYGDEVVIDINQLYSMQEQYIILETEFQPGKAGSGLRAVDVSLDYLNMFTKNEENLRQSADVSFSDDESVILANRDNKTAADAIFQTATAANIRAVELRDQGKIKEAEDLLVGNASLLNNMAVQLGDEKLKIYAEQNEEEATLLYEENWEILRKSMRDSQYENQKQQTY